MKNLRFLSAALVVLICYSAAFSQFKFKGAVLQVVDGKTVVVDLGQNKNLTVELQGIEVPEPEQQLHQVVIDHLQNLLLGKQVEFYAREMTRLKTKGQLISNGADISQQLLRDGAAWYSGNSADKLSYEQIYQTAEAQARSESRGVWSIKNLKPAWEFRREKAEALLLKQRQEEEAKRKALQEEENAKVKYSLSNDSGKVSAAQKDSQKMGIELWDFDSKPKNNLDLNYTYNAPTNQNAVITPVMASEIFDGKINHRVVFFASYRSEGQSIQKGGKLFRIAIGDISPQKNFLRNNGVAIYTAKNKKLSIGKAEILVTEITEMAAYNVSRATLEQLVAANDPVLYIGKYRKVLDKSVLNIVKKILDATK